MIEILFGDSACGSLKAAQHYGRGKHSSSAMGVIVSNCDGSEPTAAQIDVALKQAEEKERLSWENAVPIGGNSSDIFCFNLALSIGDIAEESFINNRLQALELLWSIYPNSEGALAAQEIINSTTENIEEIHRRIILGEPIRIWYSNQPDEMCGLYWFMAQLSKSEMNTAQISTIKLPSWEIIGETVAQKTGWGEVAPGEWHRYLNLQTPVSTALVRAYALCWRTLQCQNSPLRAVLNGKLVSAPATLYDDFILREIALEADEFLEAKIIGRVLGKYQLGVGDAWFALRIEEMIKSSTLAPLTSPPQDSPSYHRMLKKC